MATPIKMYIHPETLSIMSNLLFEQNRQFLENVAHILKVEPQVLYDRYLQPYECTVMYTEAKKKTAVRRHTIKNIKAQYRYTPEERDYEIPIVAKISGENIVSVRTYYPEAYRIHKKMVNRRFYLNKEDGFWCTQAEILVKMVGELFKMSTAPTAPAAEEVNQEFRNEFLFAKESETDWTHMFTYAPTVAKKAKVLLANKDTKRITLRTLVHKDADTPVQLLRPCLASADWLLEDSMMDAPAGAFMAWVRCLQEEILQA